MKGKTGTQGSYQFKGPKLDKALYKACLAIPDEPRKPVTSIRGRKPIVTIPDETIRAMKRMFFIDRKTLRQVEEAFPQLRPRYIKDVLISGTLRASVKI